MQSKMEISTGKMSKQEFIYMCQNYLFYSLWKGFLRYDLSSSCLFDDSNEWISPVSKMDY